MRISQTILSTSKEAPQDAELVSHKLMLRAGLVKKQASGIYTWLPLGLRVLRKIELIIHNEMDKIGASELLMPSVIPSELWQETDRWNQYGSELLKITDRHDRKFCYGPTHEEVITDIARKDIKSYKQLPLKLYQIQTKFRDEIRPRFGVMRSREFIMKDAYSFHTSYQCLDSTYTLMYDAYCKILNKIGLDYRPVEADSGAIGGNHSHEFQVLADAGEDIIFFSNNSNYAANIEQAKYEYPDITTRKKAKEGLKITPYDIKDSKSGIYKKLDIALSNTIKIIPIKDSNTNIFLLILKEEHELNTVKIEKHPAISGSITVLSDNEVKDLCLTKNININPLSSTIPLIVDYSASIMSDFIFINHTDSAIITGVNWDRDISNYTIWDIRNVTIGDKSPDGHGELIMQRGIEVGHIFKLGDTYSQKMKAEVLDHNGKPLPLIMGCYGFGVSRMVAATIEQSHDNNGIIWPKAIAPYQVIISPINMHKSSMVYSKAEALYNELIANNIETLFDDRKERPGKMFADADLLGIPHRIIISERSLEKSEVEYKSRTSTDTSSIFLSEIIQFIKQQF